MGHFSGLTPILALSGHSHFAIKSTLNSGLTSTKPNGTVQAIKKMTHNDNGPGPDRNYGETTVFMFGGFWPKISFFPQKITKNLLKDWYLVRKRYFFVCITLPVAKTWLESRSGFLFLKTRISAKKIRFLQYDPKFCQWPVCSPRRNGSFCTLGSIFGLFVSELRPFL